MTNVPPGRLPVPRDETPPPDAVSNMIPPLTVLPCESTAVPVIFATVVGDSVITTPLVVWPDRTVNFCAAAASVVPGKYVVGYPTCSGSVIGPGRHVACTAYWPGRMPYSLNSPISLVIDPRPCDIARVCPLMHST